MRYEIGKVVSFDGYIGYIVSTSGKYMFLDKDIKSDITVGDYVSFRGEIVGEVKKAFFISKVDNKNNLLLNKEK